GVVGFLAVKGQKAAFGGQEDLVALDAAGADRGRERLPDGAFAALVPVVDCRVENVGPEFDRARDGLSIARALDCRGVAQVRPETDRREPEALRLAEMPGVASETVAKSSRAVGRGAAW